VYERIVQGYPNAEALARAPLSSVAAILRSIGLSQKRAAQLRGYASALVVDGPSALRDWRHTLTAVPGLGAYGARAVACFGFQATVGIVDANVARVIRRVFGLRQTDARAVIFQRYADELASAAEARSVNLGLLDLGALICLPKPRCPTCPLSATCHYALSTIGVAALPNKR
jgi:A/G-specific adenine glycosylase